MLSIKTIFVLVLIIIAIVVVIIFYTQIMSNETLEEQTALRTACLKAYLNDPSLSNLDDEETKTEFKGRLLNLKQICGELGFDDDECREQCLLIKRGG